MVCALFYSADLLRDFHELFQMAMSSAGDDTKWSKSMRVFCAAVTAMSFVLVAASAHAQIQHLSIPEPLQVEHHEIFELLKRQPAPAA